MTKIQATTTMPPERFSVSQGIIADDVLEVVEQHNQSFGLGVASVLGGQVSGFDAITTGDAALGAHNITFEVSSGYSVRYGGRVWIDPDAASIDVATTVTMPASNTGRVRVTIGAANAVLTHAAGGTSTDSDTLATSATGTGLVSITIELDHQTGSSAACILEAWYVQVAAVTSGLPDPTE